MVLKSGEVKSEHSFNYTSSFSSPSFSTSSPYFSNNSEYTLSPRKGDLLVVRQILGHVHKDVVETQRENISHTRCLINHKVCVLIIDVGSCTNVTSKRLMEKLNFKTIPYPRPYKLQWLGEDGEIKVTNQVILNFSISKYKDKVLCDVVPLEASLVLLGRPWKYDKCVHHDGHTSVFTFQNKGHTYSPKPLIPKEVRRAQMIIVEHYMVQIPFRGSNHLIKF